MTRLHLPLLVFIPLHVQFVRSQALTYEPGPLLKLTQYRQQHRRTVDGRLCAAAFVQNGQTFTDCTTSASPDGQTGQEWCYVEVQLQGTGARDWEYCRPVIDYDYLRAVAADSLRSRLQDAEEMTAKLLTEKKKLDDVLERFERVCFRELNVTENRLSDLEATLQHAEHSLSNAVEAKSAIVALEASLEDLTSQYADQLRQSLSHPENCRALRGYEDDGDPDGLTGTYFPTPYFTSNGMSKQTRLDPLIDFIWNSRSPVSGIPAEAFAVRWDGFLGVPETGEYKLVTETPCGARVFIDKALVLVDRMPQTPYAPDSSRDEEIALLPPRGPGGVQRVTSQSVYLSARERVPIRIEMIHSTHLLYENEDVASMRLMWQGPHMSTQVVPSTAFFSSSKAPVLKIARLPAGVTDVAYAYPGVQPFVDRSELYIGDLPAELEGAKLIRFHVSRGLAEFQLETNQACWAWVGHERTQENTLQIAGVAFEPKEEQLTLLESHAGPNAKASAAFDYVLEAGLVPSAGVYAVTVGEPGTPHVLLLQPLPQPSVQCSGALEVMSDPAGDVFDRCLASSTLAAEYACEFGLNLHHRDQKYGAWKPLQGRGAGQYVEVFFKQPVQLTRFKFKPLDDPLTWPSELTLAFSTAADPDKPPQTFTLVYSTNIDLLTYSTAPVVTDYVKAEITQMYAAGQTTGGSFEFLGTRCEDSGQSLGVGYEQTVPSFAISSCDTTLGMLEGLTALRSDLVVNVDCPHNCDSSETASVFGTNVYSIDSAVCVAAAHASVCADSTCRVRLRVVGGQSKYVGTLRNGVQSKDHGPQDLSFVLEPRESGSVDVTPAETKKQSSKELIFVFHPITSTLPRLPANVAIDDGSVFGTKNAFPTYPAFGWLRQAETLSCDTAAASSAASSVAAATSTDEMEDSFNFWLLNGGVAFPPTPCDDPDVDCSPNYWSVQLGAHAEVDVTVQVGDPCEAESKVFVLQANGIEMVSEEGVNLEPGQNYYATAPRTTLGADGKLVLTAICQPPCQASQTVLVAVKLLVHSG